MVTENVLSFIFELSLIICHIELRSRPNKWKDNCVDMDFSYKSNVENFICPYFVQDLKKEHLFGLLMFTLHMGKMRDHDQDTRNKLWKESPPLRMLFGKVGRFKDK